MNDKIKIVYRDITELIGAEYNPRQITEKQFKDLSDSITRFGFSDPMIVNINEERKNIIIAGHQRLRVATHLGFTKVPVVEVDLTLEKEREFNIRHNKNTGAFDMDALANFFEVDELLEWGFEEWEVGVVDFQTDEEIEEPIKPITKTLSFKFDDVTFELVTMKLKELNDIKEDALISLLGIEKEIEPTTKDTGNG